MDPYPKSDESGTYPQTIFPSDLFLFYPPIYA